MSTIDSPLRFLMRFFSSFLHAYILPVARTYEWQKKKDEALMDTCVHAVIQLPTYLTGADLTESALAQHSVHAKGFICDWLRLQPLPLQVAVREFGD